jgi:hypothetical protein
VPLVCQDVEILLVCKDVQNVLDVLVLIDIVLEPGFKVEEQDVLRGGDDAL